MSDLEARIDELARAPVLLVASDYDGTLAPIVSDPASAAPDREAMVALRQLADLPQTHVAIISGRALCDLAALTGAPDEVHLVGSHGSEFDPDFAVRLPPETVALRERLADELAAIAARGNGFRVERKPASIAFHFRDADDQEADEAVRRVLAGPGAYEGVFTKHGKKVVELGVVATSKGAALETIRHRVGATAALFIGDDATDEDAFATLHGPDVGVKVGEGESRATFRIGDVRDVSRLLARLAEARTAWLVGSDAVPIERLSLLSDQRTAAIIGPDGALLWLCLPRLDSPAVFAGLLGGPAAGVFSVEPAEPEAPPSQRYLGDTFVLETRWDGVRVTDYLDCSGGRPARRSGRSDLVRVVEGDGAARLVFAPEQFARLASTVDGHGL
ncbi:MAG TPA: trehalose-phosphatase, partial [Phycisphaerales bacterium]|nr:trehalose-phosphatase [Phycisphaerales bacterium]